jgi:predicted nucleic acid-binding protein
VKQWRRSKLPGRNSTPAVAETLVVDASVMVDLLLGTDLSPNAESRMRGRDLHAPAHLDGEVLSALGRLFSARHVTSRVVAARLGALASAPVARHPLPPLLRGAWTRRHNLRLTDALYVELAARLGAVLLTTDRRLSITTSIAELVTI